jgi:outer membrane protein OmpA-like peptidoglycan-associated protein
MAKLLLIFLASFAINGLTAQDKINKQYAKRAALGINFSLNDYKTANAIRTSSLPSVLLNKNWSSPRVMSPGMALTFLKGFNNHIDVQARLNASFLDLPFLNGRNFGRDNVLTELDASGQFKMLSDKYWVTPYLSAGVGAAMYKGTHFSAFMPLGGGVQVNFYDEAFLLVNSQYRVPITPNNNYHFFHSIGIAGNIGKPKLLAEIPKPVPVPPKDTDGDGIFDKDDKCVTVRGVAKYEGCPVPDTDGDGLDDDNDKCPTAKGEAKYQGCPAPDADRDGITDEDDKCPNESGVARYQGCPVPDGDGDGINDEEDKCPTVAGIASEQGCPEIKDEVVKKVELAAKSILFETAKSVILKNSYKNLNEVVKILNENPDLKLDIEGHTDNTGNPEKNQKLSEDRAAAVMAYLVNKGIDATRLSSAGYGADQPVADNSTVKGRAQNRRVEMKLKY